MAFRMPGSSILSISTMVNGTGSFRQPCEKVASVKLLFIRFNDILFDYAVFTGTEFDSNECIYLCHVMVESLLYLSLKILFV